VLLVGDSFCFGEGIRDEDTLAHQLSLKYDGYNFRNFGWPGTDAEDVLSSVVQGLTEMPDLGSIMYIYNLNDIPGNSTP